MKKTAAEHNYAAYLVETDWLAQHLTEPDLRIFDCTVNAELNMDPDQARVRQFPFTFESGRAHFDEQHIPGAGFIDILGDLSDQTSTLPMMMPPEQQFIDAMTSYGINNKSRVVLYSTTEPNWSARVWWMLRAFGFDNAAVLNGGWSKWMAEGRSVSKQACRYPSTEFSAQRRPGGFVAKDDVLDAIHDDDVRIINALPPIIHAGSDGPVFGRRGRIAGSVNVPFMSLHDPDTGRYLPPQQLGEKFDAVRASEAENIIAYCGGGIASSNTAFALTLLGYKNVAVYDGSMLEWGNDNSLPMERD